MTTLAPSPVSASPRVSFAERLREKLPAFQVEVANRFLVRGSTAKGAYETRVSGDLSEVRTTFVARGANPLKAMRLLCRTSGPLAGAVSAAHISAIRAQEDELPWVRRTVEQDTGDHVVTVLPFGADPGPSVVVRRSARSGFVSIDVADAREMSPAEARLVAKALARASKLAAAPTAGLR